MPTGYTCDVATGDVTTLREFALRCARGMGAYVMLRDEPADAPLPREFKPSNYHTDQIAELIEARRKLLDMTGEEINKAWVADWQAHVDRQVSYKTKDEERAARYRAMIAKVEAWTGAPEGVKEFMLSQLHESLRFDCGHYSHVNLASMPALNPTPPAKWYAEKVTKIEDDIAYHREQHNEEVKRTEGRNAWIAQLFASLPEFEDEPA